MNNKKNLGIELARVIAMMMIVVLHYLDKGGVLKPYADTMSASNLFLWLLEAFCVISVNVYILISGYFLIDMEWKTSRLVMILCRIYFYALLVPVVLIPLGFLEVQSFTIYDWLKVILPVGNEAYWYMTAYVLAMLFAPILAKGVKALSKREFETVLVGLLFFFSLEKTVIPMQLSTDHYGYEFGWMVCVLLVAAYIRMYGIPFLNTSKKGFLLMLVGCFGTWGVSILSALLGKMGIDTFEKYYVTMPYTHNYFMVLVGAVGMFYAFMKLPLGEAFCEKHTRGAKLIYTIAPLSLGVYLLHEHPFVKYLWPVWLGVTADRPLPLLLLHLVGCVLLVFCLGIAVDLLREKLFLLVIKKMSTRRTTGERKTS